MLKAITWLLILWTQSLTENIHAKNKASDEHTGSFMLSNDESDSIVSGYKDAYYLCKDNFKMERWNCPMPKEIHKGKHPVSLTRFYPSASKETSYIYSLVAASIVYNMIRTCETGKGKNCPCKTDDLSSLPCPKILKHGFRRGKAVMKYLDYIHISDKDRKEFNLRNTLAGLRALRDDLQYVCRCHGVSGHCAGKTCWRRVPVSLTQVSIKLKDLYKVAVKLKRSPQPNSVKRLISKTKESTRSNIRTTLNSSNLVFLDESPDYCKSDERLGITGTLNRECDYHDDSTCKTLCSSCGYRTHSYVRKIKNAKCNCKFHWCCKVTCDSCEQDRIYAKCTLQT